MSTYPLKVIGIVHKDQDSSFGVSFPGLPDAVYELSDDFDLAFAGDINSILTDYFSDIAQGVQINLAAEQRALAETSDPTKFGYSESVVDLRHGQIEVSTALYAGPQVT